ncbi:MAG: hypothetical protein V1846_02210 [Candidatus Komeilibacteria bacterium]
MTEPIVTIEDQTDQVSVSKVFQLTLATPFDPMELVRACGDDPRGWVYSGGTGPPFNVVGNFKLVILHGVIRPNLNTMKQALLPYGQPASGWWMGPFHARFPTLESLKDILPHDGSWDDPMTPSSIKSARRGVGFPDDYWLKDGARRFPILAVTDDGMLEKHMAWSEFRRLTCHWAVYANPEEQAEVK